MHTLHTIKNLHIAVTFFYNERRFTFLKKACSQLAKIAESSSLHIITNNGELHNIEAIRSLLDHDVPIFIHVPNMLGHPYLLPWSHFSIFKENFTQDKSITHFMYIEDDIMINKNNIEYWLKGREELRHTGFIPSFLRYEKKDGGTIYSTDVTKPVHLSHMPKISLPNGYSYVNFREPYQGMYLLDRELMAEHLRGPSSSPDFGPWHIREKAAQGLTFTNIPTGFYSRNLVGFDHKKFSVDPGCLIHHLPDNYANNPQSPFAKIPCRMLVLQ